MREGAEIVPMAARHAAIVPRIRRADYDEIWAATGLSPAIAIPYSIATSDPGWAVELHGVPVAVFGARRVARDGEVIGAPWLIATDVIERYPVHFYRVSRGIIAELKNRFSRLENRTDARNRLSVRWLAWAGFTVEPPAPWGPLGIPFHRFYYSRETGGVKDV
jgi:hypothetical protein